MPAPARGRGRRDGREARVAKFEAGLHELYDRPKVPLSLNTRMAKAEAIEALLYGCNAWTLHQEHCPKLRIVYHRVLLQIIGAQRKKPDYRTISCSRALEITGCESIEITGVYEKTWCGRGGSPE